MATTPKPEPTQADFPVSPDGLLSLSGAGATLVAALDQRFRRAALAAGAEEQHFPTLIAKATLSRAEYFQSFPGYASQVNGPHRSAEYFLSPAVCYHYYELLADSEVDEQRIMTCCGRCFRGDAADESHLWEFTMREVVFLGRLDFVRQEREDWMKKSLAFARELGLEAELVAANDPFFGAENRGKKLLQQVKQLKYELRVTGFSGAPIPVASFNLHEQFFTQRFNIALPGGKPAFSGCMAFGLERWAMALVARHGPEVALKRVEACHDLR